MIQRKHFSLILFFVTLGINDILAQQKLERVKVTKNISMEIPISFTPMEDADLTTKYVSARKPIAMYTSADRQIDLGINENSTPWIGEDLNIVKDFYKANIANLFSDVTFIKEGIEVIGGREFVVFEFVSRVTDANTTFGTTGAVTKYTYIQYTIYEENVLLFNFTCPAHLQNQWQKTAQEIMKSVRIRS